MTPIPNRCPARSWTSNSHGLVKIRCMLISGHKGAHAHPLRTWP